MRYEINAMKRPRPISIIKAPSVRGVRLSVNQRSRAAAQSNEGSLVAVALARRRFVFDREVAVDWAIGFGEWLLG